MSKSRKTTVGVVGAGIAGLSAAIALSRAGCDVQVLEKSRLKNEIGAAITIMPPAVAILRSWGFELVSESSDVTLLIVSQFPKSRSNTITTNHDLPCVKSHDTLAH